MRKGLKSAGMNRKIEQGGKNAHSIGAEQAAEDMWAEAIRINSSCNSKY
jgi:hypothetical protein